MQEKKRAAIEAELRKREIASAENVRRLEIAYAENARRIEIASQMTQSREQIAALMEAQRRDAAELRDATQRYQIAKDSTDRFMALQARQGQAEAAREEGRMRMRLDTYEKAAKIVEGNPMLAYQPEDIKEAAIKKLASSMINAAQDKPSAPAAASTTTTRLKFDAQGNPIK